MRVRHCRIIKPLICSPNDTVDVVAEILRKNKQRRVIVVENEKPIGIVSVTDVNNKFVANRMDYETKVKNIMSSPIFLICNADDELKTIYTKMHEHKSYFVPVLDNNRLVGILTYGELKTRILESIKLNGKI